MSELTEFSASTVCLGRFNPLIFSPEWLHSNGMIGPDEASAARERGLEVMAPNITSLNLGTMKLVVEQERFFLTVADEPLVRAKDFPAICFRLLSHTPITAIGLNVGANLLADNDIEKWHNFGDMLAPKSPWGEFVADESGLRLGGLRSITMERSQAPGGYRGYARCTIEIPERGERVASLQMNNHFNLISDAVPSPNGADAVNLIETLWDDVIQRSRLVLEHISEIANAA